MLSKACNGIWKSSSPPEGCPAEAGGLFGPESALGFHRPSGTNSRWNKLKMIPHCIYWMNIWVNRHHSCKCVGHVILAPQIQPTCCIRCSPIKWGKLSWLAFTKKIQEGSHVRRWVIWLLHTPPTRVLDITLNNLMPRLQ